MKKQIYLLLLLLSTFAFSDVYIPKTLEEDAYLKNLRKKEITVGLLNKEFYNIDSKDQSSLNNIIKDLFKNYLQLNVNFNEDSYYNLRMQLIEGKTDIITLINRESYSNRFLEFTNTIFNETLFIASTSVQLYTLEELRGKELYVTKGHPYKKYAQAILDNNGISANIVEVEDLNEYKDKLIITPTPVLYEAIFGVKISNSGGIAIGVSEEHSQLIQTLNQALNERYRNKFLTAKKNINKKLALENFYNSLTIEEAEYIVGLHSLRVVYDSEYNTLMSYISETDGKYKGVFPTTLKFIGELLNIEIIDETPGSIKSTDGLNANHFDMIALSHTRERSRDFLFSNKIYEIPIYVVNLKTSTDAHRSIGVLNNSVEEQIALRYDIANNITAFEDFTSLLKALNSREVDNILTVSTAYFDPKIYNVSFFENVPVNIAFNKNNVLLRNIFNKAMLHLTNKEDIIKMSMLEKETEDKILMNITQKVKTTFYLFTILLILGSIFTAVRLYLDKLHKEELLKDPLTGLANRFVFNSFCSNIDSNFKGFAFAIDLNNFKKVNDSLGHEFGDSIIVEFSNFLKHMFADSKIFRISGDEFYGFIDDDIQNIVDKLQQYSVFCPAMERYGVSFSVGFCQKKDSLTVTETFKFADLAMFTAKNKKDFRFKLADEKFIAEKEREEQILNVLKESIENIYPVFQPKICLATDKIIGAEALARYSSKTFGIIPPFEFIPIAEKFNFVHKIDYTVAEKSMCFVREELDKENLPEDFRVSFNISVVTFKRDDLISVLKNLLDKYKLSGKHFEVEITESVFITDIQDLIGKMGALSELGFNISLDDFTAGHSTAGVIPLLPLNIVKFDKSLLDSIEFNKDRGIIVYKNLISLIKELNLKIVAEGVETFEQLQFLKEQGVEYAQGYYINKPIDVKEAPLF
ncbi:MAG: EAL domain-containing protein [Fusobacteriaceae bacterium]